MCNPTHTIGGYQTEDQWYITVLLTYLIIISLAQLFNHSQWHVTWINLSHYQLTRFLVYMASNSTYIEIKLKQKQTNTATSWGCNKDNENFSYRQLVPPPKKKKKTGTYAPNYMGTHHIPNRKYFYDLFSFVKKLLSTKCDHILHAQP